MTDAKAMIDALAIAGYGIIAGVPCSSLGGLIDAAIAHPGIKYIGAANEGDAVAIAAGAWLGGMRGAVFLQNSGLGNAVNPLTSLLEPFGIPLLLVIGWRGKPGTADEPQHRLMGEITPSLLRHCNFQIEAFGNESTVVAADPTRFAPERNLALLIDGVRFRSTDIQSSKRLLVREPGEYRDFRQDGRKPRRSDLIEITSAMTPPDVAIFSTTGKCSRELFELGDRPNYIYQVGSMGCVSSLALGFALTTDRRTIVLDGDGAALMRLGALATIGAHQPARFIHVMLDNESHESTGGQPTVTGITDLAAVAGACGYARIVRCDDCHGFKQALAWAFSEGGPTFIHSRIAPGSSASLGRPAAHPGDVARRFRGHFGMAA